MSSATWCSPDTSSRGSWGDKSEAGREGEWVSDAVSEAVSKGGSMSWWSGHIQQAEVLAEVQGGMCRCMAQWFVEQQQQQHMPCSN